MFSSRSVQIAAVFSDVFGQALPNLCRSFYNETKAEMFFSVFAVALPAEGVGRNIQRPIVQNIFRVALPAEGVGRNQQRHGYEPNAEVALPAEGVGRNIVWARTCWRFGRSPSPRRAWVEISLMRSVTSLLMGSPSPRRAWVEIQEPAAGRQRRRVALPAEGVGRHHKLSNARPICGGRPPRGGRG